MPVPSLGFIAGPDMSKEEMAAAKKKVYSWNRTKKMAVFAQGSDRISKTLRHFPRDMWMFKPSKDTWCIGEIMWHLADQEANLYVRLRKAIAEPGTTIGTYDHNKWSKDLEYLLGDFEEAWGLVRLLRRSNSALLKRLPASVWKKKVKHPEQGIVTVDHFVGMNIWHMEHHLGQMAKRFRQWKMKKK